MVEYPKFCPHCGTPVVDRMRTCTSCGKAVIPSALLAQAAPVQARSGLSKTSKFALLLIGIVLAIGVATLQWRPAGTSAPRAPDSVDAFIMCRQFMTDRLKAPKTAEFPLSNDPGVVVTRLDGAQFRVQGFVDAQNGFGAMIRTRYDCTVRHTGGDQWRLEALTTE